DPVALPLVADRTEPVGIRQRVRGGKNLVLLRGAADRHRPGRGVVDIGDGRGRCTRLALQCAVAIGVARHHIDGMADIGIAERVGRASRAGDVDPVALPLVADRAEAVRTWFSCAEPLIVTVPVGGSLTLVTVAVAALALLSSVP